MAPVTAALIRYRTVLAVALLTTVALTGAGLGPPLRALAVLLVIGFVPGAALLPWLPGVGRIQGAVIAVVVSLSLAALLSAGLAIAGAWTADAVVLVLAAVGVTGILCRRWAP